MEDLFDDDRSSSGKCSILNLTLVGAIMDKETKDYLVRKLKAMRKKVSKFSKNDWKKFYKKKFGEIKKCSVGNQ